MTEVLTSIQSQLVASNLNLSQKELKQLQARSHVDSKVISNKEDSQLNSGTNFKLHIGLCDVNAYLLYCI